MRAPWWLPKQGVLSAVSIGLDAERRDVMATAHGPAERAGGDASHSINAAPGRLHRESGWTHSRANGRASAAFARVACRELGFASSPFVTTCAGLQQLLSVTNSSGTGASATDAATSGMLHQLCPELQDPSAVCPNWLEVQEPNLDSSLHLDWLRSSVLPNRRFQGVPFHLQPTDDGDVPDWRTINASDWAVGPVPISPSCGGSEASVMQCFQHQVIIPIEQRKAWVRPCAHRMIVACSAESASAPGTWVVGDSKTESTAGLGAPSAIRLPKIFAGTDGPLGCASGNPAALAEIATATAGTLCWGSVLGDNGTAMPVTA